MRDKVFRLSILALFLGISSACFAQSNETITISTYYPAPYGVYNQLRLYPHSETNSGCDASNEEGILFYDNTTRKVMVCQGNGAGYEWKEVADQPAPTGIMAEMIKSGDYEVKSTISPTTGTTTYSVVTGWTSTFYNKDGTAGGYFCGDGSTNGIFSDAKGEYLQIDVLCFEKERTAYQVKWEGLVDINGNEQNAFVVDHRTDTKGKNYFRFKLQYRPNMVPWGDTLKETGNNYYDTTNNGCTKDFLSGCSRDFNCDDAVDNSTCYTFGGGVPYTIPPIPAGSGVQVLQFRLQAKNTVGQRNMQSQIKSGGFKITVEKMQ